VRYANCSAKKMKILRKLSISALLVVTGFPLPSSSQQLSTNIESCDSRPIRAENRHTETPYDDKIYYRCLSVRDIYRDDQSQIQLRETCEFIKVVYYDSYLKKWKSIEYPPSCSLKSYAKKEEKPSEVTNGWHAPLKIP
jgi:hypothetical protein